MEAQSELWVQMDGRTAFSSIKRMFGEHVTARKFPNMVKEIFLKATPMSDLRYDQITNYMYIRNNQLATHLLST